MKTHFLHLFLALVSFIGYGQYSGQALSNASAGGSSFGSAAIINSLLGDINSTAEKRNKQYSEFQGSPYVSDKFQPTTLFYNDENSGKIFYRYNALNEEIEIKNSGLEEEEAKSLFRDKKINILNNGKKMSFKTFVTAKKNTLNGYLTQLNGDEKYDLYKRIRVKFSEGKAAPNSFVKAVPSRFSQYTEYYFQKEGVDRIDEIPLSNNKLLKLLDGNEKIALKDYLKKEKLNIKTEADLLNVFSFLNQL